MTQRQRAIVDYINEYWLENWTSPTVSEIGDHVGLSSKSSVHGQLLRMTRAGILERKVVRDRTVLYRARQADAEDRVICLQLIGGKDV